MYNISVLNGGIVSQHESKPSKSEIPDPRTAKLSNGTQLYANDQSRFSRAFAAEMDVSNFKIALHNPRLIRVIQASSTKCTRAEQCSREFSFHLCGQISPRMLLQQFKIKTLFRYFSRNYKSTVLDPDIQPRKSHKSSDTQAVRRSKPPTLE